MPPPSRRPPASRTSGSTSAPGRAGCPSPPSSRRSRRRLLGEFDAPDPQALRDLARLYVRVGLGAEAEALTRSFPEAALEDRALLVDLARTVEPGPSLPEGPLAIPDPCPGRHGLWQALGGAVPAYRDAPGFAAAQAVFAALPPELRVMLAPRFVERLLDAGRAPEARLIYDTAVRPGDPSDPGLGLAAARLAAAEGHPLEAAQGLAALLAASGHASVEALSKPSLALDAQVPIPDRIVVDLRAAALQVRGSAREPELRALPAEALARSAPTPRGAAQVAGRDPRPAGRGRPLRRARRAGARRGRSGRGRPGGLRRDRARRRRPRRRGPPPAIRRATRSRRGSSTSASPSRPWRCCPAPPRRTTPVA